jgi:molybdate transport system regulatory protein
MLGLMKHRPLIRFRIDFAENANVGPGKITLLEEIKKCGSLSQAARQMGISYRRAWLLLDSLNTTFDERAVVTQAGGVKGGGAVVTAFGAMLVERYREAERQFNMVAGECLEELGRHVNRHAVPTARKVPLSKKTRKHP